MTFWIGIAFVGAINLLVLITSLLEKRSAPRTLVERAQLHEQLLAKGFSPLVAEYVSQGRRLEAVKAYRQETNLGLREATRRIDRWLK